MWIGLTSLALAVGVLLFVALARVIVGIPKVAQSYYNSLYAMDERPVGWLLLGLVMIATIIPIGAAIVLGHVGVTRAKAAGSGAAVPGIALGIGYMLLVFWFVRLVNAITNAAEFNGGFRMFIEYVGIWA